ncbi:unnamed protein product [Trypanosoma congolense IL3000]|uniref:WGS project CAEQ00000000 data, annotated contig 88 n=1 Tax=Trypanosoma congolense (strain IL3000) TaxID=1068625 RepID=F9WJ87_TRYCI|nr:unnamed protein product [Trypanosoma congolense IL3000]
MVSIESQWNVASGRPCRANRGTMLQQLLEKGLNSDEEKLLHDLSDVTSDSTFTASEETLDEVDSDFSDEEVEGVLEGTKVVTDATLEREERLERKKERQRTNRHAKHFGTGGAVGKSPMSKIRLRRPSTIPLEERLRAAHERGREVRAAAMNRSVADAIPMGVPMNGSSVGVKRKRSDQPRGRAIVGKDEEMEPPASNNDDGEVVQRVRYTSSVSVLQRYGVPVVISFSKALPGILTAGDKSPLTTNYQK